MSDEPPQVIIIAGPNGAGKTTLAPFLLRERFRTSAFVNADAIASGLSAFDPENVAIEAGRIMLRKLHELSEQRQRFAFETTLAARSYAPWIRQLQSSGYEMHLLFVSLRSTELAIERVAERVRRGGHTIPLPEIRCHYQRGLQNLFELYIPLADTWAIYDNSESGVSSIIAMGEKNGLPNIARPDQWESLHGHG